MPSIDGGTAPTSLSSGCVNDVLRDQLNFDGLIFTDALNMKGATQLLKGSACVNALLAGNDVLLMPENINDEIAAVKAAVANGKLSQSVIDERCKKILRYKYALDLTSRQHVNTANLLNEVNSQHAGVLKRQLIASSITVIKNNDNILPIHNLQSRHIAVATIGNEKGTASTFTRRCADYAQVKRFDLAKAGKPSDLAEQLHDGHFNTIIVEVGDDSEESLAALNTVVKKCKNVIIVLTCKPYDIKNYGTAITHKHVKAVVLTYDNTTLTEDYAAQTIFGGNAAGGNLPISLAFKGKKTRYEAGDGIHYEATRLGYTIPAEVGLDNKLSAQIDSVCRLGVQQHAFPGCQVIVARHGKVVYKGSFGAIDYNKNVAFFSLEMDGIQLAQRLLCSQAQVDQSRLRNGKLNSDEIKKIIAAVTPINQAPLFVDDNADLGIMELMSKARQLKHKGHLDLLIIDYLQLMKTGKEENRAVAIGAISRGLKILAKELSIPVIALAQLSRKVEEKGRERPQLSDLRESGSIEQDADMVWFVERPFVQTHKDEDRYKATLIVAKHRNGSVKDIPLTFIPEYTTFYDAVKGGEGEDDQPYSYDGYGGESEPVGFGDFG